MRLFLKTLRTLILFGIIATLCLAAYSYDWYHSETDQPEQAMTLLIKPGTGFSGITQQLAEAGLIDYPLIYKAMVVVKGAQRDMKAGEYMIARNAAPADITALMVEGKSINHSLTFQEGLTTREILAKIAADDRLTGEVPTNIPEGVLMPDTYQFHRGDTKASLVKTMRDTQQEFLNKVWPERANFLPYSTIEEVLILASIIESETGVSAERAKVAGVFVNRLRKGMPLQSDPTVVYGIERAQGKKMERQLLRTDLQKDHPHNTYTRPGLPPTPIANPSRASIKAVLNPEPTDALYFVATGKGGHYFSKTLAEHNQNVQRYKQELRRQKAAQQP